MLLREVRDAIDWLNVADPWKFTGEEFLEGLAVVELPERKVFPPFEQDLDLDVPFLLVDHISHVPEVLVRGFLTLQDLEREIPRAYTNGFTSHCIAFAHGKARPFRIIYRDAEGRDVVFSKRAQIEASSFSTAYANARIEWL